VLTKTDTTGGVDTATCHIGFVGDSSVGKTTVATLVGARLAERTQVTVTGEATRFLRELPTGSDDALGIEWTVEDCPAGVDAIRSDPDRFDVVFVVVTPETLASATDYERVADRHGIECFLIGNQFRESTRERVRSFDGPDLAEYVYADDSLSLARSDGHLPTQADRSIEAVLIEALQPERLAVDQARAALERGERSIVNVEVTDQDDATSVLNSLEAVSENAAYFTCNCRCHDGHVLARR